MDLISKTHSDIKAYKYEFPLFDEIKLSWRESKNMWVINRRIRKIKYIIENL